MNALIHAPEIRRRLLQGCVGFLVVTAALAAFSVLAGEFGDFEFKVMLSSLSISIGCVCTMAWVALPARANRTALGPIGFVLNFTTLVFVFAGIWLEVDSEPFWKCLGSVVVVCIAAAHASLLMIPRLPDGMRWLKPVAIAVIGLLAFLIDGIIWAEDGSDQMIRLVGAVAIGVVLLTLVIPIVSRLANRGSDALGGSDLIADRLHLTALEDGVYEDRAGARYRVERLAYPYRGEKLDVDES